MSARASQPRIALCLEQTLGHRAHARNIVEAARTYEPAAVTIFPIEYKERGPFGPPWAVRGSAAAASALRRSDRFDAALFHTQTVALFARHGSPVARYVVSVDATPIQMDHLGHWYNHRRGTAAAEYAKRLWYGSVFSGARTVVAWSEWAAKSLVDDYGVREDRLEVVHPGAPIAFLGLPVERPPAPRPRILFVGGDFERKGGPALIEAWSALRDRADLDLVTSADVPPMPGLQVLRGLEPGSEGLLDAYRRADVFCLPTLADCTSVAIGEAMAAGLPVVTTRVGSNEETAPDGRVGFLVAPGDASGLARALDLLVTCRELRLDLGREARARAARTMNSAANAKRLLDVVRYAASQKGAGEVQWAS